MAHITGGGLTENIPRMLPSGCDAVVTLGAWTVPPVFALLQRLGTISEQEMFRAFNMGVGLVVVCASADVDRVLALLRAAGEREARMIGVIDTGAGVVRYRS
jgi:phosphoribosylformylglycinamidine cyclo-ligase